MPEIVIILGVSLVLQALLFIWVMRKGRSDITQTSLILLGVVPGFGILILGEQALFDAGLKKRKTTLIPEAPLEQTKVSSLEDYRKKLKDES